MRLDKVQRRVLFGAVAFTAAGLLASTAIWMTRSAPTSSNALSDTQHVAADDLLAMYRSNELAAAKAFGSAPLTVNGVAGIVDFTPTSDVSITLVDSREHVVATALMLESSWRDTEKLSHGDRVSLRCSSVMLVSSSLILKDCSLNPEPTRRSGNQQ